MTDSDLPFLRPALEAVSGDTTRVESELAGAREAQEPIILDPELHQSVWKPWQQEPGGSPQDDGGDESSTVGHMQGEGVRTTFIVGALGFALALVVAVVVRVPLDTPTWWSQPLVMDMPTKPDFAWTSEGGRPCPNPPNEDQAVLTDTRRVWSLDLNSGQTRWSVDLEGRGRITCLPGVDLVAVTMIDERCSTALEDPPRAITVVIAFSNAGRVRISRARMP